MRTPSAAELLNVWERGRSARHAERALLMLAAAEPDASAEGLAALTVGRRDAGLLRLRERLFGPHLESVTRCPACGELLELTLDTADLLSDAPVAPAGPFWLDTEGGRVLFRLPTSADLLAMDGGHGASVGLLERCVEEVVGEAASLPPDLVTRVAARMAEADPLADVQLSLSCPACGERWIGSFDAVSYLWDEIDAWAHRTLREVHLLARAYGWGEVEILSLSPLRRHAYLDLVGA